MKKERIAFIYDFDGTLSPGNMQEYAFIPKLNKSREEFWKEARELGHQHNADPILIYMYHMLKLAAYHQIPVTKQDMVACGKNIKFFRGVESWFARCNSYAQSKGLELEHYILSSGLAEFIEGCAIAGEFKGIFASCFMYDANNVACWPAQAINYTSKTQFLFRINKGALNVNDNEKVNSYIEDKNRDMPFSRMVYFGDGYTDIPSMKLVKVNGGHSIAVYDPDKQEHKSMAAQLLKEGRVNFFAKADYAPGSDLEHIAQALIHKLAADINIENIKSD